MVKTLFIRLIAWLPLVILYGCIYFLSNQAALPGPEDEVAQFVWFKTAHVMVYSCVGLFSLFAVSRLFQPEKRETHKLLILYISLVIGIALAAHDEWHQSFVPGRESTVRDLVIDTLAIGAMLSWLARYNFTATPSKGWRALRGVAQMARAYAWGA
jgi:VanZ family protein